MIYIFESKLSENKSVFLTLKYIYGIGKSNSFLICKKLGFSKNLKIKIGSDLKKLKILSTKKLIFIKSYKGIRKIKGLPIRGQRTHTNAKTSKKRL